MTAFIMIVFYAGLIASIGITVFSLLMKVGGATGYSWFQAFCPFILGVIAYLLFAGCYCFTELVIDKIRKRSDRKEEPDAEENLQ